MFSTDNSDATHLVCALDKIFMYEIQEKNFKIAHITSELEHIFYGIFTPYPPRTQTKTQC